MRTIDQVIKTNTSKRFVIGQRPIACPRSKRKMVVKRNPVQIAQKVTREVRNLLLASE